jgi:hypothetical protein
MRPRDENGFTVVSSHRRAGQEPLTPSVRSPSSNDQLRRKRENTNRWLRPAVIILALAFFLSLWLTSRREFISEIFPSFRVTEIEAPGGIMKLVHGNRRYLVRCGQRCAEFKPARSYPMKNLGDALEYTGNGKKIRLPIMQVETTFDAVGGHG